MVAFDFKIQRVIIVAPIDVFSLEALTRIFKNINTIII